MLLATTKNTPRRRGATTVEFALTAPILFLLVMGAVEFCRANIVRHTATVAAIEAARQSIIPGATAQDCLDVANSELAIVGITSSSVAIDPAEILSDTKEVTVSIDIPLDSSNGFILAGFTTGITVSKAVTLQRESKSSDPTTEANRGNNGNGNGNNGNGNGNGNA